MNVVACLLLILPFQQVATTNQPAPPERKTLQQMNLPPRVKNDILKTLLEEIKGTADNNKLQDITLKSLVTFVTLGTDGTQGILIDGGTHNPLSGANGDNTPSWLFQKSGNHAVLLYENVGVGIAVEPTIHNGMHDISSAERTGGRSLEIWVEVDEYDGSRYKPAYCYESSVDEKGKDRVTPHHPCNQP